MARVLSAFSKYVRSKREKLGLSYNDIAAELGVSKPYIYDIEKGNNKPPIDYNKLDAWAKILKLTTQKSRDKLFDLSVEGRGQIPSDVVKIILQNPKIKEAIRSAIINNLPDEVWENLIKPAEHANKEEENNEE